MPRLPLLLALAALWLVFSTSQAVADAALDPDARPHVVSSPQSADSTAEARFSVRVQLTALQEAPLAAGIPARIRDLPLREGDSFKKGDLLVRFDCADRQAELQRAQAGFSAARTKLKANEELSRLNSVSTVEVDLSRAEVKIAEAEVAVRRAHLLYCRETAPFSGRVASLAVKRYQRVTPGEPLMTLVNPSRLEAECIVPSQWLRWLQPGLPFQLHIEETGDTVAATVDSVAPYTPSVRRSRFARR